VTLPPRLRESQGLAPDCSASFLASAAGPPQLENIAGESRTSETGQNRAHAVPQWTTGLPQFPCGRPRLALQARRTDDASLGSAAAWSPVAQGEARITCAAFGMFPARRALLEAIPTAMAKNPSTVRAAAGRRRARRVDPTRTSDTPHNEYKNARSCRSCCAFKALNAGIIFNALIAGPSWRKAASIASQARPSCKRKSQAGFGGVAAIVFRWESVTKRLKRSPFNGGVRIFCT
jgi:hypothetical protein